MYAYICDIWPDHFVAGPLGTSVGLLMLRLESLININMNSCLVTGRMTRKGSQEKDGGSMGDLPSAEPKAAVRELNSAALSRRVSFGPAL